MSCTPEAEMESHEHKLPVILPPRRTQSSPGRYGIDPAPVGEHDGEPLTRAEALKFWVPVLCFCAVAGLVVGLIVGSLKS